MDQDKVIAALKVLHEVLGVADQFTTNPEIKTAEQIADEIIQTVVNKPEGN